MSQSTAELLATIMRRSLPLIILLMVLGATAVNVQRQLRGPQYSATARLFLSTTDLGALVAGIQPSYVDPRRVIENALSLARSPELYERAADGVIGLSGPELRAITTVSASQEADLLFFTVESSDADTTVDAANAVAAEYPTWRAEVATAAVQDAIQRLRDQLATADADERRALETDLRRLELLETLTTGNAVLVEEAEGASKISPAPVRDTVLGASIGLVLALLFAGARELLDTRVRSEAEVEELLNAPIVASIGRLPRRATLVAVGRHGDRFADSYALLAANLMQMRPHGKPTVVAVTSAVQAEGKTITTANLGVALAQRGARVILADFDLRKSSLARVFNIPSGAPGVVQTVRDNLQLARALLTISLNGDGSQRSRVQVEAAGDRDGAAPSLRVLPAGGTIRGTLTHYPRVEDVIEQLTKQADIVLIDTPPALSTADMADLSPFVDLVLVVSRQGRATRRSLVALNRQAQTWTAGIAGVVVTDALEEQPYYYNTA